jgi:hypothetical protein
MMMPFWLSRITITSAWIFTMSGAFLVAVHHHLRAVRDLLLVDGEDLLPDHLAHEEAHVPIAQFVLREVGGMLRQLLYEVIPQFISH